MATIALAACGAAGAREHRDGTAAMADTLAAAYARSVAEPRANPFLSRERAAMLRAEIQAKAQSSGFWDVGRGDFGLRYLLAYELAAAGESREAITTMEALLRDGRLSPDRMTPQNKGNFDLLGISWMKLAEQENCNLNPSAGVCILPLDQNAWHQQQQGARRAIAVYSNILQRFPDDYGSKWLLNLAYMALGEYPKGVPPEHLIPGLGRRDTSASAFPRFYNVAGNVGLAANGMAGGVSVADFDHDGRLDLFKTAWGLNDPVQLFMADGAGGFVDRTAAAGLTGIVGGLNVIHADYDNDGWEDVLIVRGAWLGDAGAFPMSLLHNRGNGTFEDVTFAAGLGTRHPRNSAAWADFNRDGLLDLFVGNESGRTPEGGTSRPSELFVNNGDGTFTDVAKSVGIDLDAFVKGVTWGDVNNDGLPDLYASVMNGDNHLFVNRGGTSPKAWRFEDVSASAGVQRPYYSFPTWFWDYDNDGHEDLLVLSYDIGQGVHDAVAMEYLGKTPAVRLPDGGTRPIEQTRLYHNNGDGTFTDVADRVGLGGRAIFAMGSNFGDLDNDGWQDFYLGTGNPDLRTVIPNRMFRSVNGQRFEEVTLQGGFGHIQKGHATAFADFDRDGDEDVFMVMGGAYQGDTFASVLFENPGWPKRNWVTLELEGNARSAPSGRGGRPVAGANRSAIGARVRLVVADSGGATRTLYRTVRTGGSFGSGALELHVGLGGATRVAELHVEWPDAARSTSTFRDVGVNRTYRIPQGGALVALDRAPMPFRTTPQEAHRHGP